ncbi:MAG: hypothetical protein ABI707_00585 [Ferruginibacter sp.]
MIDFSAFRIPDAISIIVFCIYAFYLAFDLSKKGRFFFYFFLFLALLHFVTTIIYIPNGKDSIKYFSIAYNLNSNLQDPTLGQGVDFIYFFTYFLIGYLKLSYTGCYFFCSLFGLTAYYLIIQTAIYLINKYDLFYKKAFFYILLLPGLHYWNVALGKDSIMFFAVALFFWGIIRRNIICIAIGAFLMGIIRSPVLALFAAGTIAGNTLMNRKVTIIQKSFLAVIGIVLMIPLLPLVQARLKLQSVDYEAVNDYIDYRLTLLHEKGSYIDMSNSSPPVKFVSFLFRPFFYDAKDWRTLASSFENIVWLSMVIFVFLNLRKKMTKTLYSGIYGMLFFSFMFTSIAHSSTVTNLGIAVRMKTMYFFPLYLLVFLSYDFIKRQSLKKSAAKEIHIHKKFPIQFAQHKLS